MGNDDDCFDLDDDEPKEETKQEELPDLDDMMDEEEETEELYPEESVLPAMVKKQKYAFIA